VGGVVAQRDPGQGARPRQALPRSGGGIEVEAGVARQAQVHRVEHGGLAGAVVTDEEEVPAIAQFDGLVNQIMETDQA